MKHDNFYLVLGVSPASNLAEIKKAYRKLALQFHPDIQKMDPDNGSDHFKLIHLAYKTLTDSKSRIEHDRFLANKYGKQFFTQLQFGYNGLLQNLLALNTKLSTANKNNIDFDYLYLSILLDLSQFSASTILFNETNKEKETAIVSELIKVCEYLPFKELCALHTPVINIISVEDNKRTWYNFLGNRKWAYYINKYTIWIVLLLSVTICSMIMIATK